HRLGPETRAVLLQNGMGTADAVHLRFPRLMTVIGTTTNAAYRSTPRRLVRARRGETWIGDGPLPLPVIERHILSEALAESGLHAAWDNDLKLRLWHKLVLNCAVNPVTALLDVPNGVLAGTGPARTLVAAVCIEAAAVMQAEGLPADARTLIEQVVRLAHESGRNVSSMRADVRAGRTTEIDFINGYLLARAQAHGLQAPCNRTLTELIRLRTATAGGAA
ncbi:MAG TPA: 2-dehydropantoate 2-reductase, partial [Plasticicumulans sp.]|nr:2-dehydropantoate 2-reductase [Plasticicumulans sp.]